MLEECGMKCGSESSVKGFLWYFSQSDQFRFALVSVEFYQVRFMAERKKMSIYQKALAINLDLQRYGVFAEIGAGQETANWFFRVSGSAGTVAKTISAYDMTMSDALYGKVSRYVSQSRLHSMLTYEYDLLEKRLGPERGKGLSLIHI